MRCLVTGGAGFIGTNLVHHLLHGDDAQCCPGADRYGPGLEGAEVLNLDLLTYAGSLEHLRGIADEVGGRYQFVHGDVCDVGLVHAAVKSFQPDVIFHLAAESHVDRSIRDGVVFARTNVLGTQVLLDAARRHDVDAFVHVSTDEVYGSIDAGSAAEGAPFAAGSPYAASKCGADLLALAHHNTYGLPVAVTRCSNNYGPRQHPEKFLPKMMRAALAGDPLTIYGDGLAVRDWLYVRDHATALLHVLGLRRWGEAFNVAGRDEKTNLEVAREVLAAAGRGEELLRYVEDRPGHDRRYSVDDAKLRATGWAPTTSFEEGFRETLAWNREVVA